jgi:hypothetical protein
MLPTLIRERIFMNLLNKPGPEPIEHIKFAADDCARGQLQQGRIRGHLQNLRSFALEKSAIPNAGPTLCRTLAVPVKKF